MELKVYDWEYFDRGKTRYLIFGIIILTVIVLSILSNNIFWWVLVLLTAWWYIFYLTKVNNTISMVIWKNALQVWNITFAWNTLSGFVLEYHTKKEKIQNIVLIDNKKSFRIYTINDSEKNLKDFINELSDYIPMLESYEQSTWDKGIRKLKL